MSGQHTPGPWHAGCFVNPETKFQCKSILDEGRYMGGIATVYEYNGIERIGDGGNDCPPHDEAVANALLIASAPEMFEAMTEFCSRVDAGEIRSERTYASFKAILAKATPTDKGTTQ